MSTMKPYTIPQVVGLATRVFGRNARLRFRGDQNGSACWIDLGGKETVAAKDMQDLALELENRLNGSREVETVNRGEVIRTATAAEVAKAIGLTRSSVQFHAVRNGMPRSKAGHLNLYNVQECVNWYNQYKALHPTSKPQKHHKHKGDVAQRSGKTLTRQVRGLVGAVGVSQLHSELPTELMERARNFIEKYSQPPFVVTWRSLLASALQRELDRLEK